MEFYSGIVPIEAVIGEQGGITSRSPGSIHYESGYIFTAVEHPRGRYRTSTGLEAIYSNKNGLLLFVSIRDGIRNGAYFHAQSIYAHWAEVEKACSVVVREHVYDVQDRPDKRQELACRMIYSQQALKSVLLAQGDVNKLFRGLCDAAYSTLGLLHRNDSKIIKTVSLEAYRGNIKSV